MNKIADNIPLVSGIITAISNLFTGWINNLLQVSGVADVDRLVDAGWQIGVSMVIVTISFFLQKFFKKIWPDKRNKPPLA